MVPLGAPIAPSKKRPAKSSPPKAARQLLLVLLLWEGTRWRMETETKMADHHPRWWKGKRKGEGVR